MSTKIQKVKKLFEKDLKLKQAIKIPPKNLDPFKNCHNFFKTTKINHKQNDVVDKIYQQEIYVSPNHIGHINIVKLCQFDTANI